METLNVDDVAFDDRGLVQFGAKAARAQGGATRGAPLGRGAALTAKHCHPSIGHGAPQFRRAGS